MLAPGKAYSPLCNTCGPSEAAAGRSHRRGAAEPALITNLATGLPKAAAALEAVLRECIAARCVEDDPQLTAFIGSIEQLNATRRDTDWPMGRPLFWACGRDFHRLGHCHHRTS